MIINLLEKFVDNLIDFVLYCENCIWLVRSLYVVPKIHTSKENIDRAQSSLIAISSLLFLKPLSIIIRLSDLRIISIVSKCQVINFSCSFWDDPKISSVIFHIKFDLFLCLIIILIHINKIYNSISKTIDMTK